MIDRIPEPFSYKFQSFNKLDWKFKRRHIITWYIKQKLTVNKADHSTFPILGQKTFGDSAFDLTATDGASGNEMTYSISNKSVATVSGSTVTIVGAGETTSKLKDGAYFLQILTEQGSNTKRIIKR